MHLVLLLIALLGVSAPAPGMPPEREDQRRDASSTVETVVPETSPAWDFEVFLSGGFAGLAAGGNLRWGHGNSPDPTPLHPQSFLDVSHHAREQRWGAGFRAMRGRWGVEAQYHRISGRAFHPSSLIGELPFRQLELRSPEEPQDLLTAQGLVEVPVGHRKTLFLGFGAGYARSAGSDAARIEILDMPIFLRTDETVAQSLSSSFTERDQRADRLSFLVGGSAGVTLQTRQFLVRPRIDVFLGRTRHAEASWDTAAEFDLPDAGRQSVGLGIMSVETDVRPLFVLFGVDLGWSSRR